MINRRTFLKFLEASAVTYGLSGSNAYSALKKTENSKMKNIVLIAGPGGTAFNETNVQKMSSAFETAGANVTTVGDGKSSITKEDISTTLKEAALTNHHTTMFIMAHGDVKDGQHAIDIDGNYGLSVSSKRT